MEYPTFFNNKISKLTIQIFCTHTHTHPASISISDFAQIYQWRRGRNTNSKARPSQILTKNGTVESSTDWFSLDWVQLESYRTAPRVGVRQQTERILKHAMLKLLALKCPPNTPEKKITGKFLSAEPLLLLLLRSQARTPQNPQI